MKELDEAKNLNGFIELATLVQSVDVKSLDYFKEKLYIAFFKFANRTEILKDLKALKKANELHSKIIGAKPFAYYVSEEIKDSDSE